MVADLLEPPQAKAPHCLWRAVGEGVEAFSDCRKLAGYRADCRAGIRAQQGELGELRGRLREDTRGVLQLPDALVLRTRPRTAESLTCRAPAFDERAGGAPWAAV